MFEAELQHLKMMQASSNAGETRLRCRLYPLVLICHVLVFFMLVGKNVDSETKCPKADSYFRRLTQKETSCEHPQSGIETQHKSP